MKLMNMGEYGKKLNEYQIGDIKINSSSDSIFHELSEVLDFTSKFLDTRL